MTALAPDERPLLLLNVVDDQRQREVLGEVFGIFLLHAADEDLALLATCDIACAMTAEIRVRAECRRRSRGAAGPRRTACAGRDPR